MADFYKGTIPILDESVPQHRDILFEQGRAFGAVPRDYSKDPKSMFAVPSALKLYDPSEWDALYDEQEANKSSLEHIYLPGDGSKPRFVNLDQNGQGFCWDYSNGHAFMIDRLVQNLPVLRVNPHASACIIKNFHDEGGWCGLGMKGGKELGWAIEGTGPGQYPLHSMRRSDMTPAVRAAMLKLRVEEDIYDLTREAWDQHLTSKHLATLAFLNRPCPSDFNWWGHSVCQLRWVRIEKGVWGPLILNSWLGWGRYGLAVLRGSKATANGAVATLNTTTTLAA